jgi:CheY-like chemotaxis protein
MLGQMLAMDGHRVTAAANGQMGLRMVREQQPDLIITDILMPEMDGIEMIMALRKLENTIPIIAISGGRRNIRAEFNLDSAGLLGVAATLTKPVNRSDLKRAVSTALGQ